MLLQRIVILCFQNPKGIFLGHKGLGDDKILPVVKVIEELPRVETVDLSDNRLTGIAGILLHFSRLISSLRR